MTSEACVAIILAFECSPGKDKKRKRKQYWMKEWFEKTCHILKSKFTARTGSQVDYNNFMRMEHSTFLELLHMFLYQRLNSN
jgi:hypothetical protein